MNCKAVEKSAIAYLDGTLDANRRREVEAHLADCGACRERAREFRAMFDMLEDVPAVWPSAGFDAAVRTRVAQEGARRGLWGWLLAPSPSLAAGVTALLVFSVWLSSMPSARHAQRSAPVASAGDAEFKMIADLPVLEDYDVLANFEVLSELSAPAVAAPQSGL